MTLPVPSSSWIVVDGEVWPADTIPKLRPGAGPRLNAARQRMKAWLDSLPDDNVPTPRGEGDD